MNRIFCLFGLLGLVMLVAAVPTLARVDPPPSNQLPDGGGGGTTSPGGGGGSTPTTSETCFDGPGQCFGAVAINCTGVIPNNWGPVQPEGAIHLGCYNGTCWIHAGSWSHDECCASTPSGRWCGGPLSALNQGCIGAWNRAVHRTLHGLYWQRSVHMCRINNTGRVNFQEYCAPAGTILDVSDGNRCCSGQTRAYRTDDLGQSIRQAVVWDGTFYPVVCTAVNPTTTVSTKPQRPKACTSTSQCQEDELCSSVGSTSGRKRCVPY
jgi:hypothetical protein